MRIFGKQLLLHLGTLVISLVLLGLVLTQGMRNFITEQRAGELKLLAERVALFTENFWAFGGRWNEALLGQEILNINRYTDASVAIIGSDFNVMHAYGFPGRIEQDYMVAELYLSELHQVMDGYIISVYGTATHPILERMIFVAHPVMFNNEVAGAALVGFSVSELESAITAMHRITILALLVTAGVAFVLIYLSSRAISKPLRQINEAAEVIANGDLEKRIATNGNDEVAQLAAQFNRMAESLQEQEQVRNNFLANLSHDIRSPLTSMKGFLTAIADGTVAPEEQPYYLGIVLDESERLIKLSNDILDIQRMHGTEIVLDKADFDINSLIRKTIMGFSSRALSKNLIVTGRFAHPEDFVSADEDKIQRVLYNLVDNAVKFTEEGGEVIIETTASKGKVVVSVSDNGRGMTKEEQKYIFDRFYKGDTSRGKDKTGSGLGLSIVKAFVRAHGEDLTVESAPKAGSKFCFTLQQGDNMSGGLYVLS